MSTVSTQTLKKNIGNGIKELCEKYSLEGETEAETNQLHASIEKIMYDAVAPLFETLKKAATVAKAPSTSKKASAEKKKSNIANYYAYFHSQCSKNGKNKRKENPPEMTFRFLEEPRALQEKQQTLYLQIIEDAELYEAFTNFETTNILEAVDFIESHLKIDQMTRTAMLWSQFVSEEDQKKYTTWYNGIKDDITAVKTSPPKVKAPVRIKATEPESKLLPVPKIAGHLKPKTKPVSVDSNDSNSDQVTDDVKAISKDVDALVEDVKDLEEALQVASDKSETEAEPEIEAEPEVERAPTPPPPPPKVVATVKRAAIRR